MPNEFIENLKRDASANPVMAMAVTAGLLTAASKVIESIAHHKGSNAYAKYARLAEKNAKK